MLQALVDNLVDVDLAQVATERLRQIEQAVAVDIDRI
jgi:hypothetical protein